MSRTSSTVIKWHVQNKPCKTTKKKKNNHKRLKNPSQRKVVKTAYSNQ